MGKLFKICIFLLVIGLMVPAALRQVLLYWGSTKVESYLQSHETGDDLSRIRAIALFSHLQFQKHRAEDTPWIYRILPVVTHPLIPEFFRVPVGAVEFLYSNGVCDSAARNMVFMLGAAGYQSHQVNIITSTLAHSGVSVDLEDGQELFVDPLFGVIAKKAGQAFSLKDIQSAKINAIGLENRLTTLVEGQEIPAFYSAIDERSVFARQGEEALLDFQLPHLDEEITLGSLDQDPLDVIRAGQKLKISPFFHYLGSRYDRAWMRMLRTQQALELIIIPVDDFDMEIVVSSPSYSVSNEGGRTALRYRIGPDQPLILKDRMTPYLFPLNRNFVNIDQIHIRPIDRE